MVSASSWARQGRRVAAVSMPSAGLFFFFQAEDGIRDIGVTGVQTCALPICQMKTLTLRVPYPLGFFSRHASGRIDDPNAGWKGRGFWSSYSMYTPWHQEGGKGARPKIVKFQVRPDPLAK